MRKLIILSVCILSAFVLAWADEPPLVTPSELPAHRNTQVRIRGIVHDVFRDERDSQYIFFLIESAGELVYVPTKPMSGERMEAMMKLTGAEVVAIGPSRRTNVGYQPRLHLGFMVNARSITVVRPPPNDPFLVPAVDETAELGPTQIQRLGRRRLRGQVVAVWGGGNILVRTPSGRFSRIELAVANVPVVGDFIESVGFVNTDLYRLNLTRAIWRKTEPWEVATNRAQPTTAAEILTDGNGMPLVNTDMYGKSIQINGIVRTISYNAEDKGRMQIDNNGYLVPVDASACPETLASLSVGCQVRITGICLLNIGNCQPNAAFPQVNGFTLVVNSPSGIEVVSRPSWWTTRRLGWLLAAVLASLAVVLVWNRSLSVLAERRGRQLSNEQVARAVSDLKVSERTRLSAELHDALSQTLSGIAMQLGAIKRFSTTDPERMSRHLDIASRTLKSCRDEMRNILWDLRSQVLDEPDIEKAIQQILEPCSDGADIRIRFAVPRDRLTESTARAIFCIVRELVVNAIRHGGATSIRIAGSVENGLLLCSVRDNGCGFDPASAPGAEEGHFGLVGIRERVDAVGGTIEIESAPGRGTRVSLSMPAPFRDEREENET